MSQAMNTESFVYIQIIKGSNPKKFKKRCKNSVFH